MTGDQVGAATALAVIGLLLIVVSAVSRDGISNQSQFGNHLSKIGLMIGGFFMLPLVLMLVTSIIIGGWTR